MIKKNGGIFGRNPTYNDVVVEGTLTMKEAQVFDNDITINGDLTVNGTETVINTVELNVDDKNITMGAVVAKVGLAATTNITAGQFTVQLADTSGLIPGMTVTKTSGTGAFGVSPKIASVDSHTQITLTVAHATSGTIIFDTGGATDDTADGGGITLKGTTDKFIKWVKASVAWVFSDPIKAPDVTVDNLTASQAVFTDANKKLVTKSQADAANAILPAQTSASGKYLKSDGTNAAWDQIDVGTSDITGTLPVANGGTGGTTQADARTGLGLGSIATQAANNVAITGGAIDGVAIGGTNASTGKFSQLDVDNIRIDANAISSTNTNGLIELRPNGTGYVAQYSNSIVNPNSTGSEIVGAQYSVGGNIFLSERQPAGAYSDRTDLVIRTNTGFGVGLSDKIRLEAGGNLQVLLGNLVIGTSGKGIDFSATAGTGTSELFNDYEEGEWTPQVFFGGAEVGYYYNRSGTYTKIGRTVICQMNAYVGILAGQMVIKGLPFTAGRTCWGGYGWVHQNSPSSDTMTMGVVGSGTTECTFLFVNPGTTESSPYVTIIYTV